MNKAPKILFFDIETSPVLYLKFQKDKNPFFSHDGILEDAYMISAVWKMAGDAKIHSVSSPKIWDDYAAVKTLRDALAKADIVVGHNIKKFDLKFFNSRLIYHRLQPLPQLDLVDTLLEVKKIASFTSHKLDYLSKLLNNKGKIHVDFSLWKAVVSGDKEALNKMVKYNVVDVRRTEELYNVLKPYMKSHPHVGVIKGLKRECSCPKCGSDNIKFDGVRVSAAGIKTQQIQCHDCHGFSRIPFR